MDVSYTRKAPSIRCGGIHSVLSAPPRISIQWVVIVKYAFIHLECHRCHLKASFTSFQVLSLLNLLINSTCKLDISGSIQCEVNKTAIHHCIVTIWIICQQQSDSGRQGKQNNAIEGRNQNWKKPGSSTCKTSSVPLWWYPFSQSLAHLGSKLLV